MQGQKQIYMFLMFIIFIMALNFCRKAIKRDKELKQQRDDALKRKVEADIIEQKLKIERLQQEQEIKRQRDIVDRMKEQKDKCYDLYIFGNRPTNEMESTNQNNKNLSDKDDTKRTAPLQMAKDSIKQNDKIKSKKNNAFSEPIIYLFVLVLIYFLMKAASDITQHFKMKSEKDKIEDVRRCSLQEYAERRNSKATFNHHAIMPSVEPYPKLMSTKSLEEHRKSRFLPDYVNPCPGAITEPGTLPKTINLNANRPQLLRRCSVPAFSMYQGPTNLRRPSMDSFSEGDGSPDSKRRVRMIHRH